MGRRASDTPPSGRLLDLKTWKRRAHYELFRKYKQPYFSVTVEVDVSSVWHECRSSSGPPFFLASLFLMLRAVNDVEAFRLRLRGRRVWLHDRVAVGPTVPRQDGTFGFVRLELADRLDRFVREGKTALAGVNGHTTLEPSTLSDDIVFHSVLPWFRFSSLTNALPGGDHSIPRLAFGKCTPDGAGVMMPVAVEVHHAVVDGLDVARFIDRFADLCKKGLDLPTSRA
jgi:chloramphenicol O-acetyltransferase type A